VIITLAAGGVAAAVVGVVVAVVVGLLASPAVSG